MDVMVALGIPIAVMGTAITVIVLLMDNGMIKKPTDFLKKEKQT
jgi:hypothetical protein